MAAGFDPDRYRLAGALSSWDEHPTPFVLLEHWFADAADAGVSEPRSVTFVTAGIDGRPSARTVLLKRVEADALVFSSALWTRKAREVAANPHVALLFYWPSVGRQVHVTGEATIGERELALELFAERELAHQVQTLVSRQGEPIEDLGILRARHAHLMETMEAPPQCPPDWGAIRVVPHSVEFWEQAEDRMHERLLYERQGEGGGDPVKGWRTTRLAP